MRFTVFLQLSLMMFLEFFIMGAWYVTVGNYMKAIDMGPWIHWAYTVVPLSAIVSPYFLGLVADRFFATEKILAVLHLVGGVAIFCAPFVTSSSFAPVTLFVLMLLAHSLCFAPTIGLTCSLAFHHMTSQEKQFPFVRVFGTIGWIAAGYLVSWILDADKKPLPLHVAGLAGVVMGLFCFTLPHTPPCKRGERVTAKNIIDFQALRQLVDYPFVVFLLSSLLICVPMAAYYSYAPVFVEDLGLSYPGYRMSFGQKSEILFMLVIPLLFAKLGAKWMIVGAMLAWGLRYMLFALAAFAGTGWMIMTAIILHGICYDFFFVTGQIYVDKKSPAPTRAQAQGFFVLVTTGVGQLIGAQLTGWLYNDIVEAGEHAAGPWRLYWSLPAVASGVVMVLFALLFYERRQSGRSEGDPQRREYPRPKPDFENY